MKLEIPAAIKLGIYQHYKGKSYRVVGTAKHSETLKDLVIYEAMYDNPKAKLWVRPLEMFMEKVDVSGTLKPRFEYVGEAAVELHSAQAPDDIRAAGWMVAIHNDYRQNGQLHTFWLFTKGDRAVKGEGKTDEEALTEVRKKIGLYTG